MTTQDLTPPEPATGQTIPLTPEPAAPVADPVENTEIWIIRIDGAEHQVAAGTPESQIRETLAMTYPGARDAAITYDSVIVDGQKYKVLVFTKRAGTKGASALEAADELSAQLIVVPAVPLRTLRTAGSTSHLFRGQITFDELLTLPVTGEGLLALDLEETDLCTQLAALPSSPVVVVTVGD